MAVISLICFVALLLTLWFHTDVVSEYSHLFGIEKWFKCDQYITIEGIESYPLFLLEFYNNFFTRLLSCPICVSTWLGLFSIPVVGWFFPIVSVFGLLFHLLIGKLL